MKANYTYEIQTKEKMNTHEGKFLKTAKRFLRKYRKLRKDEIIYVIKATLDGRGDLVAHGAYYGPDVSPLHFTLDYKGYREDIFLAEALSSEAIIGYLLNHREEENRYNLYILKVDYKKHAIEDIESLYGGRNKFTLDVMHSWDEDSQDGREILKTFGKVKYVPELMEFYGADDR